MRTPAGTIPPTDLLQEIASQRLAKARSGPGQVFISDAPLAALLRLAADASYAADALLLLQELPVQRIELEMELDELRRAGDAIAAVRCG